MGFLYSESFSLRVPNGELNRRIATERKIRLHSNASRDNHANPGAFPLCLTEQYRIKMSRSRFSTTCMSAPKQHHRTGAPIPAILAGELMPNGKQCELADYRPDAWTCWDTSVVSRSACRCFVHSFDIHSPSRLVRTNAILRNK